MKIPAWMLAAVLVTSAAQAAIFPEAFTTFTRGKVTPLEAPDKELYKEYGFVEAEKAEYSGGGKTFTISGWKVKDSTGAMALWQLRRPADAQPSKIARLAVTTPNGLVTAYGNFVFEYQGYTPSSDDLDGLLIQLKQVERSALPSLINYLPDPNLIPNSERYILGPVSLTRFAPQVTPTLAAFHLSTEAQQGRYKMPGGELTMTIFYYPTPNHARAQQEAFLQVPGTLAKRAGPMVAVISNPGNTDDAERVLASVQYDVDLNRQSVGTPPAQGLANLVVTGSLLALVLVGASVLAGIWLGGFRSLLKKFGLAKEQEEITVFRINAK
jgi:hypothetical protein